MNNKEHDMSSREIKGKNVLLVALSGYSDGIMKKMKEMGANVDYINDKPNNGLICKSLGRLKVGFYQSIINQYYKKELERLQGRKYDYVLIIRGEYTPTETLQLIRKYYPQAKLILYMWDSLYNNKGIEKKWELFDVVYTFDRIDYLNNQDKIHFLPLYYYEDYLPETICNDNYEYLIGFIGTGHQDRIKIAKEVKKQCDDMGERSFIYCYMPHKFVYYLNKMTNRNFKGIKLKDVHFKMLPFSKVYEVYSKSQCIMDVESSTQHGLTMRSIEMIGLKRKFITTNADIVNYDFYNSNNILVVDRNNFVLDWEFFRKPYVELDEYIYQKYSLHNWIINVLSGDELS